MMDVNGFFSTETDLPAAGIWIATETFTYYRYKTKELAVGSVVRLAENELTGIWEASDPDKPAASMSFAAESDFDGDYAVETPTQMPILYKIPAGSIFEIRDSKLVDIWQIGDDSAPSATDWNAETTDGFYRAIVDTMLGKYFFTKNNIYNFHSLSEAAITDDSDGISRVTVSGDSYILYQGEWQRMITVKDFAQGRSDLFLGILPQATSGNVDAPAEAYGRAAGFGQGAGNAAYSATAQLKPGCWYIVGDANDQPILGADGEEQIRCLHGGSKGWQDGLISVDVAAVTADQVIGFDDRANARIEEAFVRALNKESDTLKTVYDPATGSMIGTVKPQTVDALKLEGYSVAEILAMMKRQTALSRMHTPPIERHYDTAVEVAPTVLGHRFGSSSNNGSFVKYGIYTVVEPGTEDAFESGGAWYKEDPQRSELGDAVNVTFGPERADEFQILKINPATNEVEWMKAAPDELMNRQKDTVVRIDSLRDSAGEDPYTILAWAQATGTGNITTAAILDGEFTTRLAPINQELVDLRSLIETAFPLRGIEDPSYVPSLSGPLPAGADKRKYLRMRISPSTGRMTGSSSYETNDGGATWSASY